MATVFRERVLSVHHWTDKQFSFTTTRDPSFRFLNGQFTMIGIEVEGKPLMRAYSMVSANYDEYLEFLSIKVQSGPLTSRLQHLKVGDTLLVNSKAVGTLIMQNVLPGRNLYLLCTGTGLAPFMSIIKDPETYDKFDKVILAHGCGGRWSSGWRRRPVPRARRGRESSTATCRPSPSSSRCSACVRRIVVRPEIP